MMLKELYVRTYNNILGVIKMWLLWLRAVVPTQLSTQFATTQVRPSSQRRENVVKVEQQIELESFESKRCVQ